jgi:hypothetical protein
MWLAFLSIVAVVLALDLGILHRKQHQIEVKESPVRSAFYIALGLVSVVVAGHHLRDPCRQHLLLPVEDATWRD